MAVGQGFQIEVQGVRELQQALLMLPKSLRRTPLTNALKKAGEPTRALAAANCPRDATDEDGKHLADTIRTTPMLNRNQRRRHKRMVDGVEVFIGSTSPLAHLVEFGTAERFRKNAKTGTGSTGRMPAFPFLTRAWDSTKDKAMDIIKAELWKEILKAAKRVRKRAENRTLSVKVQRELL